MSSRLNGRIALVTGGSSGIGKACAQRFRAEGATVFVADLRPASSDEIELDVSDSAAWNALIADLPPLDIVMLNAGITTPRSNPAADTASLEFTDSNIADITDAAYRTALGVNLDGVFFGARAVVPGMMQRGHGDVLITASVAGLSGMAGDLVYSTTKHAVVGFTRSLGASLAATNVCVSALCPGFIDTPLVPKPMQKMLVSIGLPMGAASHVADGAMTALTERVNGSQWVVWGDDPPRQYEWNPPIESDAVTGNRARSDSL
jgi:NAD(P)-dependent dehydrogenase (short-subunit alcohol dehydrogenase family)